jgi:hypothetical protein
MEIPSLKPFSLVGGTALSLRYGHRSSVDLDLFYHEKFDSSLIEHELMEKFGTNYYSEGGHKNFGIFCYLNKVKVDIVYFPHLPIAPIEIENGIRFYQRRYCSYENPGNSWTRQKKGFLGFTRIVKALFVTTNH